jgi:hypothetical protein
MEEKLKPREVSWPPGSCPAAELEFSSAWLVPKPTSWGGRTHRCPASVSLCCEHQPRRQLVLPQLVCVTNLVIVASLGESGHTHPGLRVTSQDPAWAPGRLSLFTGPQVGLRGADGAVVVCAWSAARGAWFGGLRPSSCTCDEGRSQSSEFQLRRPGVSVHPSAVHPPGSLPSKLLPVQGGRSTAMER